MATQIQDLEFPNIRGYEVFPVSIISKVFPFDVDPDSLDPSRLVNISRERDRNAIRSTLSRQGIDYKPNTRTARSDKGIVKEYLEEISERWEQQQQEKQQLQQIQQEESIENSNGDRSQTSEFHIGIQDIINDMKDEIGEIQQQIERLEKEKQKKSRQIAFLQNNLCVGDKQQ